MVVQASAGQRLSDPSEALDNIARAAHQAEQELGRLVTLLADEDASAPDLDLVRELVRNAAATGLEATVDLEGEHRRTARGGGGARLPRGPGGATNALRYAAGACPCTSRCDAMRSSPSRSPTSARRDRSRTSAAATAYQVCEPASLSRAAHCRPGRLPRAAGDWRRAFPWGHSANPDDAEYDPAMSAGDPASVAGQPPRSTLPSRRSWTVSPSAETSSSRSSAS